MKKSFAWDQPCASWGTVSCSAQARCGAQPGVTTHEQEFQKNTAVLGETPFHTHGHTQTAAAIDEHKRAKRWTALLFSSSKPKPSELQLRKGELLRRTPRPCLAQAPLPLPISLASRISATAPFFKNPLAGPLV